MMRFPNTSTNITTVLDYTGEKSQIKCAYTVDSIVDEKNADEQIILLSKEIEFLRELKEKQELKLHMLIRQNSPAINMEDIQAGAGCSEVSTMNDILNEAHELNQNALANLVFCASFNQTATDFEECSKIIEQHNLKLKALIEKARKDGLPEIFIEMLGNCTMAAETKDDEDDDE